jgi:hypothetical protein
MNDEKKINDLIYSKNNGTAMIMDNKYRKIIDLILKSAFCKKIEDITYDKIAIEKNIRIRIDCFYNDD